MTKARILEALALVAITIGVIAVIPHSRGENTDNPKYIVEAVGSGEYGVEIIDPSNPMFDKLMAEKRSTKQDPFSVFVVNNNSQAIASCTLRWEILLRDGRRVTHFKTKKGTLETISDGGPVHLSEGIVAKGNLIFSLPDSSDSDNGSGIGFTTGGSNITNLLSDIVKVTVSVDGVLFVDGTYVGPDAKNYFELFRGQIDGSRELATEVSQLINDGAKPKAVLGHLEKVVSTQSSEVEISSTEVPQYSFGKWLQKSRYARLLLAMRNSKGDQAVLDRVQVDLSKPQITLRKLKKD